MKSFTHAVLFSLAVATLSTSVSAWSGPQGLPPSNNVAEPINVSTNEQFKPGTIGANIMNIFGSNQYLNFGNSTGASGFGIRNNSGILEFKNSGGVWSPLQGPAGSVELTSTRDDAGLQGNAGARSGFFETLAPTNYPAGATNWWHLLDVRHTNTTNNYAMQIAGSFFDQALFYRKTNGSPTTPWRKFVSTDSTGVLVVNQGWTPAEALSLNSNQIWKSDTTGDPNLYLQWSNPGGAVVVGGQSGATNHLAVYGKTYSRDGVEFGDSTIQTTAAIGQPHCRMVRNIGAAPNFASDARCAADEMVLSGGGRAERVGHDLCSGAVNGVLHYNGPDSDMRGWSVDGFASDNTTDACTEAWAICCH